MIKINRIHVGCNARTLFSACVLHLPFACSFWSTFYICFLFVSFSIFFFRVHCAAIVFCSKSNSKLPRSRCVPVRCLSLGLHCFSFERILFFFWFILLFRAFSLNAIHKPNFIKRVKKNQPNKQTIWIFSWSNAVHLFLSSLILNRCSWWASVEWWWCWWTWRWCFDDANTPHRLIYLWFVRFVRLLYDPNCVSFTW